MKCDAETTPQADRDLGIVNIVVGFATLKPAEFVIITIQRSRVTCNGTPLPAAKTAPTGSRRDGLLRTDHGGAPDHTHDLKFEEWANLAHHRHAHLTGRLPAHPVLHHRIPRPEDYAPERSRPGVNNHTQDGEVVSFACHP